ncbi:AAA family ATPase [Ornithinicoccus hortensis]|uniref:Putative kinase n=1 Tax=Ornithinicoccus hortensis TaxID=82346 RepID=A0A542YMJ9_9MICO|nr:AAA family ATPase [Ornithinicoccus hortensis]TQL49312.1 putative kinase [Ornithinicoccus hortensis]
MSLLALVNGAPGSGKSTVVSKVVESRPLALALDVDLLKHSLGRWADYQPESGLAARRLALALARAHLTDGRDVLVGQYLARTPYIEELEHLAGEVGARWCEVVLDVSADRLRQRLSARRADPQRPEHLVNGPLSDPEDAEAFVASMTALREERTGAVVVDANGGVAPTVERLRAALAGPLDD